MGDIVRKKWMTMMDAHAGAVDQVYGGPVGLIWEMLAGEGADGDTGALAERAGLGRESRVLALLSGPGEAARRIARKYGCTVIGLVPVPQVVDEVVRKTEEAGLAGRVDFQQGNALDMSFHDGVFDTVWGEDAWCYVIDKDRMIREAFRVLKSGGTLAFTDWVEIGPMGDDGWHAPETFRAFPYFETVESYREILERNSLRIVDRGEVLGDPARQVGDIHRHLRDSRDAITELIGEEAYDDARRGLDLWERAAGRGLIGRGWLLAEKP